MRWLVGVLGVLMLTVGLGVLGLVGCALASGTSPAQSVGELWFTLDVGSLNALQVLLERYLWPPLWEYLLFPFLTVQAPWAAAVSLAAGLILAGWSWLGRRKP